MTGFPARSVPAGIVPVPTLTVDQPTLDKLERLAADRGLSVGEWLARTVEREAPPERPAETRAAAARRKSMEKWLREFAERHARPTDHPVDDSRDSIYEPPRGI